jgi:hypothetical protein
LRAWLPVNSQIMLLRTSPISLGGDMILVTGLLVAAVTAMAAAAPVGQGADQPNNAPAPSQGSVSPSGKFVPAPTLPGQDSADPTPGSAAESEAALKQALKVRQIGSNTFQIGTVEFDKQMRTVSLPAQVAVRTQVVEYALVHEQGKAYESLFTTVAKPSDVQVAFLLLGVNSVPVSGDLNKTMDIPSTNALRIEVTWAENGQTRTNSLCDLVSLVGEPQSRGDQQKQPMARPMPPRQWFYNGSIFNGFGFAAEREGSIISIIRDSAALVNNPGDDRDNDEIHFPNTKALPPEGSPARIVFRLPGAIAVPAPQYPGLSPITPLATNYYAPNQPMRGLSNQP